MFLWMTAQGLRGDETASLSVTSEETVRRLGSQATSVMVVAAEDEEGAEPEVPLVAVVEGGNTMGTGGPAGIGPAAHHETGVERILETEDVRIVVSLKSPGQRPTREIGRDGIYPGRSPGVVPLKEKARTEPLLPRKMRPRICAARTWCSWRQRKMKASAKTGIAGSPTIVPWI